VIELVFAASYVIALGNDRVTVADPHPPLPTLAACAERAERMAAALLEQGADDVLPQCLTREAPE